MYVGMTRIPTHPTPFKKKYVKETGKKFYPLATEKILDVK
jgi:hypothetical protein